MCKILNKITRKFYYSFIISNAIAYTVLILLPVSSIKPNIEFLVLLNLVFIVVVLFFSFITYKLYPVIRNSYSGRAMTFKQLNWNILIVSIGSNLGFFLIFYDRVFIRSIDYSQGLRHARYEWLASTGGSLQSIVGNLIIPLSYVCIFFLIVHFEKISIKYKLLLLASSIIGVFGFAALNGGRSNILLAIVLVVLMFLLKSKSENIKLFTFSRILKVTPLLILTAWYVISIVNSSASMANVDIATLTHAGIKSLYGVFDENFNQSGNTNEVIYLIIYCLSYLVHGQWTTQIAYSLPYREGSYTFYSFSVILNRLGLLDEPLQTGYFSETGAFISLPGAFYYDFGFFGVVFLSTLLGFAFGYILILVNYGKNISGIKLAIIIYVMFLLLLSPVVPAYGFMYLNFIVFAFVLLDICNRLMYGHNSNWLEVR